MVIESLSKFDLQLGPTPSEGGGTLFRVWAPLVRSLDLVLVKDTNKTFQMERCGGDMFVAGVEVASAGDDYFFLINGERSRPDPVSRWQPKGVHGPSRVVHPGDFEWTDQNWRNRELKDLIIYELHTGTFTPEGTFDAIIPRLSYLVDLGINAIELMPVAEFPGGRNWGYDGVHLFAPQSTYGGPVALKRFIDACHRVGLSFILDVVYNHLGPEGNYLSEFAPFFSDNYRTPWGDALNFDGPHSDGVRRHFIENAVYWSKEFHVDGLRLDAIHRIIDLSPVHILENIATEFRHSAMNLGKTAWVIGESDFNDVRVIKPVNEGGYGLDAQWSDDFHHALHASGVESQHGYFADFQGLRDVAKAITEGFAYDGRYSHFRMKSHGNSSADRPGEQFVVCIQNHDQVANAYWGERLGKLVSIEKQKLLAAILLSTPNVPLLFMGQEWGETNPFYYFTSHTDAGLAEAVFKGRREEYSAFVKNEGEELGEGFANPQSPETFEKSKLDWGKLGTTPYSSILDFYKAFLELRNSTACLSNCDKKLTSVDFDEEKEWLVITRGDVGGSRAKLLVNFSDGAQKLPIGDEKGLKWVRALWSGDPRFGGNKTSVSPPETVITGSNNVGGQVTLAASTCALYFLDSFKG